MKKIYLLWLAVAFLGSTNVCCSDDKADDKKPETPEQPDKPDVPDEPVPAAEKPVILWIDAEANFSRLRNKSNITYFLQKARDCGFNTVVVDVKPVQGDVLYQSDFLPTCTTLDGFSIPDRGFDYLQYFIDEVRRLDMKITVSTTIMTMGLPATQTGPAYTDPRWEGKTCIEYLPTGMQDIKHSTEWGVFTFLNPILPEVREYVMRLVEEVVTKYDFDGYALDYCRYCNMHSDFSQASKEAFEKWANVTLSNFPQDIYIYNSNNEPVPGTYYNQWMEWRASVIRDYIAEINRRVHAIKPDLSLELWAASWWPLPHTGQNWASPKIDASVVSQFGNYLWMTPGYYQTGFADQLDVFQLGAYLERVFGPNDNESVEYAINKAEKLIAGDCTLYGTIGCADAKFDIENAVYLCLKKTAGVMVFELSHVLRNDMWDKIKAGIDRAERELGIEHANNEK